MPSRCILHIGHAKTATTHLQHCLHVNHAVLLRHGFWVPSDFTPLDGPNFTLLSLQGALISGNLEPLFAAMAGGRKKRIAALEDFVFSPPSGCNIVLSTEMLFYYVHTVADIVAAAIRRNLQPEIVIYLARQDHGAISAYLQNIRAHAFTGGVIDFLLHDPNIAYFSYLPILQSIRRYADQARITIRTFDPVFLKDGNVLSDFLATINCPVGPSELAIPPFDSNRGLKLEQYELIRAAHLLGRPDAAGHIGSASIELTSADRARTRGYYYTAAVKHYLDRLHVPDNVTMLREFMPRADQTERLYWQRSGPIQPPPRLDRELMQRLWTDAI